MNIHCDNRMNIQWLYSDISEWCFLALRNIPTIVLCSFWLLGVLLHLLTPCFCVKFANDIEALQRLTQNQNFFPRKKKVSAIQAIANLTNVDEDAVRQAQGQLAS